MFYQLMTDAGAKRLLLINSSLSSYAKRKSAKRKVFATCSFLFRFLRNKEMVLCILPFQSDLPTLRVRVTLVVYKVTMFSKNNLFQLNLISCHGNKRHRAK